ncbi:MAG: thymidylate kinase [Planctomycetes bacterium]|nr:thymidylate kinase [Planctomycetota bacterium]
MPKMKFPGPAPDYIARAENRGKLIVVEGTDGVGRSTHVAMARKWLEVQGHAVAETGWTRSKLVGQAIDDAKAGHTLASLTFTLIYACDFCDRLEKEVIPALSAGYFVLADRYIYTAIARAVVRGLDEPWVRDLFSFAPIPDLVIYLRVDPNQLARRVLLTGGMDYWEAGKDHHPELDIYDSFLAYQTSSLTVFDRFKKEFGFVEIDAARPAELVQEQIRQAIGALIGVSA